MKKLDRFHNLVKSGFTYRRNDGRTKRGQSDIKRDSNIGEVTVITPLSKFSKTQFCDIWIV